MPIPHRLRGARLTALLSLLASVWSMASAQQQAPSTHVRASLGMLVTASSNSNLGRNVDTPGKKELIVVATPGLEMYSRGWLSEFSLQGQVNATRYVRGTQSDRALPSGFGRLRLDVDANELGMITTVQATQTKADFSARSIDATTTSNTYTDVTLHATPYVHKQLDANNQLDARFDRGLVHSISNDVNTASNNTSPRRDAFLSNDSLTWQRKPTPLGWRVEARQKTDRFKGEDTPSLEQTSFTAATVFLPTPELQLGLSAVHAEDRFGATRYSSTALGLEGEWRPTERTRLTGSTVGLPYGRTWQLEALHRWKQVSVDFTAQREATTAARDTAQAPRGDTSQSLAPNPNSTSTAPQTSTPGLQPYETVAQLREYVRGRVVFMGVRHRVSLAAGRTRSSPILSTQGLGATTGPESREYFLDLSLSHRLTPYSDWLNNLHWGRNWSGNTGVLSRNFSARTSVDTRLSPSTTTTIGMKREIYHSRPESSMNDTSGFVGVNHRF
jgi:uncharacterized protein (PEP-CTERM system associated)